MGDEDREEEADDDPECGADQGRDDALVSDHLARLRPREAHGAQHADLTRALEHRQDERVHDSEQADDHGQREQHVQQADDAVERFLEVRLEFLVRLDLRVRKAGCGCAECLRVRIRHAALDVDERHLVLRVDVVLVEQRVRDRHRAERRPTLRELEDAVDLQVEDLAGRSLDRDRRADVEVVLLRVLVVDERTGLAELCRHRVRAFLPVEVDHLGELRVGARQVADAPEHLGGAGADPRNDRHAGRLRDRLLGGDRERGEGVL